MVLIHRDPDTKLLSSNIRQKVTHPGKRANPALMDLGIVDNKGKGTAAAKWGTYVFHSFP